MPYEPPRTVAIPVQHQGHSDSHGATDSATGAAIPTLSDTLDDPEGGFRSIYVGTGGNISVVFVDGSTATFLGVPGGSVLPVCVRRIRSTGTTATNLLGLR